MWPGSLGGPRARPFPFCCLIKKSILAHFFASAFSSSPTPSFQTQDKNYHSIPQDALKHLPLSFGTTAKIYFPNQHQLPTPPHPSALPSQVELNFGSLLTSSRSSSLNTATIPGSDFPVFTTDSTQSTWLPSSTSSLPASPAQQLHQQQLNLPPQQDFVLYDQPIKHRQPSHRSVSQPSAIGGVNQTNQQQHSPHNQPLFPLQQQTLSPSLQNQRVANIIQATGHQTTSSALTNRFSSSAQSPHSHQLYASSAPSSSVALNLHRQNIQNRPVRPPVPLFSQSTGNVQRSKMNLAGMELASPLPPRIISSHCYPSDLETDDFTAFGSGAPATAYSSPGFPPAFDFSSASSSATNMATVSPQDLLITDHSFTDHSYRSAPNSAALTTLTSPSIYNASPDFGDGYDVSPDFGSNDFDPNNPVDWFPLFPQTENQQSALSKVENIEDSPATQSDELEIAQSKSATSGHHRRKSSQSPPSGRHSSISGVNPRRRDKPLPPIIVDDPSDTIAMKRARNTLAARKSRERKAHRLEDLEEQLEKSNAEREKSIAERDDLKVEVDDLKAQLDYWKSVALAAGAKE